jgi:hypothetical protein
MAGPAAVARGTRGPPRRARKQGAKARALREIPQRPEPGRCFLGAPLNGLPSEPPCTELLWPTVSRGF